MPGGLLELDRRRGGLLGDYQPRGLLADGWEAAPWPQMRDPAMDAWTAAVAQGRNPWHGAWEPGRLRQDLRATGRKVGVEAWNALQGAASPEAAWDATIGGLLALPGDVKRAIEIDPAGGILSDLGDMGWLAMSMVPGARTAARPTKAVIRGWHGSPHDYDRVDMRRIGTGTGQQTEGWGYNLTDNRSLAEDYRDYTSQNYRDDDATALREQIAIAADEVVSGISDVRHKLRQIKDDVYSAAQDGPDALAALRKQIADDVTMDLAEKEAWEAALRAAERYEVTDWGRLYEVEADVDLERMIDLDRHIEEQPAVLDAVNELAGTGWGLRQRSDAPFLSTEQRARSSVVPRTEEEAAFYLARGIPGVRYSHRVGGQDTRSYVIFDPKLIRILRKYGVALTAGGAGGAMMFSADDPALAGVPLDAWGGAQVQPQQ